MQIIVKKQQQKLSKTNYSKTTPAKNNYNLKKVINPIKEKIIRDIRNLFQEEEENYHKPEELDKLYNKNFIIYESRAIKKKHYQLKNILIKLDDI